MTPVLDFVGEPRAFLAQARASIESLQDGGLLPGTRSTALLTAAFDNLLRGLFARAQRDGALSPDAATHGVCLAAVGGYARREVCPRSDLDLVLLHDGASEPALAVLAERVLYPLWDDGLQVGQAVGTVAELLDSADADPKRQNALFDLRFLAGSSALFVALGEGVRLRLDASWRAAFLARVRPDNLARWRRFGDSVFLLEPNVKEGRGGLRDFHWLLWIARVQRGLRGDQDLLLSGLMQADHYRTVTDAWEFLLRVRIQLHQRAGRAEERLRFEHQEPIARALGFRRQAGLKPVERFMGEYYRHAYALAHLTSLYAARLLGFYWDEEALEEGPIVDSPDGHFRWERGAVRCLRADSLADPLRIVALFAFLQEVGGRLHHETTEEIRAALPRITPRIRRDPAAGAVFRGILEGRDLFRVLAAMHRSGFLGRYVPEFGKVFCQAQHNRVHLYTVDVHSLYAVRELERLIEPEVAAGARLFALAYARATPRGPLILAALFHDIAKRHGAAHSRVGAEWMPAILGRMGWDEGSIRRVQWLVQHHLVLSETAYHRDVHDPATLAALAAVVPDRAHLDDLMALTFADTRATNPELWTSWKQSLLEDAYLATTRALDPAAEDLLPPVPVVAARVEALLLSEVGRKRAPILAARLLDVAVQGQPRWYERLPPASLATFAILLDQLTQAQEQGAASPFVTHTRQDVERGVTEWTVAAPDRRGLFALLAGVLGACGLSIVSAVARTRDDGVVLDTFYVTDAAGRPVLDERRWKRVDKTLSAVARGEEDLAELLSKARAQAPASKEAGAVELARVEVSNTESEGATVVEIVTQDRVGLLHDVTAILRDHDLDLTVARIATRHDLASDTFYVQTQRGKKLSERGRRELLAELRERILSEREKAARPGTRRSGGR